MAKRILILANHQTGLYKMRKELLLEMVGNGYKVYASVPDGEYTSELKETGCRIIINKHMDRRGTNPLNDLDLFRYYLWLIKKIKPKAILTYTIKPNVYGGIAASANKNIPCIANVTGLGTSIQNGGLLRQLTILLYYIGLKKNQTVFFQNEENRSFMVKHRVVRREITDLLPGSGVNTVENSYEGYPDAEGRIVFLTVGRIMKDKGIEELLSAADVIYKEHPNVIFRLIGEYDEQYQQKVEDGVKAGFIEYLGTQKNVHAWMADSHAIIHASYHEGMSNILQEAASTGRPVIATDVHGCIETFDPDMTGIAFKAKNTKSLIKAIEKFLSLDNSERAEMGRKGREKMIREFDRKIVIDRYMKEIRRAEKKANATEFV